MDGSEHIRLEILRLVMGNAISGAQPEAVVAAAKTYEEFVFGNTADVPDPITGTLDMKIDLDMLKGE